MSQVDLFMQPIQDPNICVFHDESGDYGHSKWVYTGLFWINNNDILEIDNDLKNIRDEEEYYGEIHFKNFPKRFAGEYGAKARVAKDWFNLWKRKWSKRSYFNVLCIDKKHPNYNNSNFTKNFHEYNRFVAMAMKSGLSWFFKDFNHITLFIHSDEKSRRPQDIIPDGTYYDNFEEYLKMKICNYGNIEEYKGPEVTLGYDIQCLACPKMGPFTQEEELLQLTDLLIGSVSSAVEAKSKHETKSWFGTKISFMMNDIRQKPYLQKLKLHRKFSVSYFPVKIQEDFNNGPMEILNGMDNEQCKLIH